MDEDISIADEHFSELMWEQGNPWIMANQPYADLPSFGGWKKYLERHADDDEWQRQEARAMLEANNFHLHCSFKCHYCGCGITFINRKPFDRFGSHRCLAEGKGKLSHPHNTIRINN